jgi:hypothetical protein
MQIWKENYPYHLHRKAYTRQATIGVCEANSCGGEHRRTYLSTWVHRCTPITFTKTILVYTIYT